MKPAPAGRKRGVRGLFMGAEEMGAGPPREEKKEFVHEKFSAVSPKYDLLNTLLSLYIDHLWRINTARELKGFDGPILDLCAGTLPLSREIVKQKPRRVIALDFCFDMLRFGIKERPDRELDPFILPVCADGEELPFGDGCFSGVTVAFGVRNLGNLEKGLSEMFRILTPGGKAVILEFSRPSNPLFGPLYKFYLFNILPRIAGFISGDREAYEYLAESIYAFKSAGELKTMMEQAGFIQVRDLPMTFGIVTLYTGHKPALAAGGR